MKTTFDWKRFWCGRGETINLSDRGYLADPDSKWGKYLNSDLISLDGMSEMNCVALLGEPGIGKSWDLQRQYQELTAKVVESNQKTLRIDLRSYADETRFVNAVFEGPEFQRWRNADYVLHLFLDSLDECLMRMDNIATLLADELPKQPVERLRLRVACRTAVWPGILERALGDLFPEFRAFEMAPLRRVDVRRAAELSGINNPDGFLERIATLDATPLAIKPVTLEFLIGIYLRDGEFPTEQLALYESGCRLLCEEQSDSRIGSRRVGRLSPLERLTIASRIAGTTQFANRYAVYTGTEADGVPPEDVSIGEITGGTEQAVNEVSVTRDAIEEVLDTGLFSSRGPNRLGWAHQTYSEFLAARYCKQHQMPVEQLRSLLFHPAGQGDNLVPQLRDLAGWTSALNPVVFQGIAENEPESLLGAAGSNLSDAQRVVLVDSLLGQCGNGRGLLFRWDLYPLYSKLNHRGLADQLRLYLQNKTLGLEARIVATDMTRTCGLAELGPELAAIAIDAEEELPLRTTAAAAVAEFGSVEVKIRLRPLAFGEGGNDPDDELKGSGLKALWPDQISMKEIRPLLKPPKRSELSSTYTSFLERDFVPKMKAADIPEALDWFCEQEHRQRFGPLDRTMDQIVEAAWTHIEEPNVAAKLADAAVSRMRLYDSLTSGVDDSFEAKVREDAERRQKLLQELMPRLGVEGISQLIVFRPRLLSPDDFDWLIERVLKGRPGGLQTMEAKLVAYVFDYRNAQSIERLWAACLQNETLDAECGSFFKAIELDSPLATMLRENLALRTASNQRKLLDPPPVERVKLQLSRIEDGQIQEWQYLVCDLALEPTSQVITLPGANVTILPGWREADESVKQRIIKAAEKYVTEGEPNNESWIGTSSMAGQAVTGFHALSLLLIVAEDRLTSVSAEAWCKWVPILLRYGGLEKDDLKLGERLVKRAYAADPAGTIAWMERVIDSENEQSGYFFLGSEIEACWDERMAEALLRKVADPRLKAPAVVALFALLSQHNVSGWRELAESFIDEDALNSETRRARMRAAVDSLIVNTPDAGWGKVWPIFLTHKDFGREVIESLSYGRTGGLNFIRNLTEQQLGEFYVWMVENYPIVERKLSGAMSSIDTATMFRDSLLESLKKRSSFAVCDAIGQIMEHFPEYKWLERQLEEAKMLARAATWRPISPRQFLEMARDSSRRFVETPDQLIEAILGSLARLQTRLRDELPAVKDLWNDAKGIFWPKDEQELSTYVARHLRDDLSGRGIIVNREVQIRRGTGVGTGQATDIHVDATIPGGPSGSYERTYVIVEVKGNWHPELLSAMKTQLRDRYLKNNACKNGIYLIGWFSCDAWNKEDDSRKKRCPKMTLEDARAEFRKQAEELSKDGYLIRPSVLDLSLL